MGKGLREEGGGVSTHLRKLLPASLHFTPMETQPQTQGKAMGGPVSAGCYSSDSRVLCEGNEQEFGLNLFLASPPPTPLPYHGARERARMSLRASLGDQGGWAPGALETPQPDRMPGELSSGLAVHLGFETRLMHSHDSCSWTALKAQHFAAAVPAKGRLGLESLEVPSSSARDPSSSEGGFP